MSKMAELARELEPGSRDHDPVVQFLDGMADAMHELGRRPLDFDSVVRLIQANAARRQDEPD